MKLTRRERAAMELALAVLRHSALITTRTTDGGSEQLSQRAIEEAGIALAVGFSGLTRPIVDTEAEWGRVIRARLALYLRARLRAERGDCGRTVYRLTARRCRDLRHNRDRDGRCRNASCGCYVSHRRIRSLWEMAPSHGGGR